MEGLILALNDACQIQLANDGVAEHDFCTTLNVRTRWGMLQLIAPVVFHVIRTQHLGIASAEWQASWTATVGPRCLAAKTAGKSSAEFLFSADRRFLLKTIAQPDFKRFCEVLPQYYDHVVSSLHDTLINWHVAVLHFKPTPIKHVSAIILLNALPPRLTMSYVFDLKGSTKGRGASSEERRKVCPCPAIPLSPLIARRGLLGAPHSNRGPATGHTRPR